MKLSATVILVSDITKSTEFYKRVLFQRVLFNFGQNIAFEGGLALHLSDHFATLCNIDKNAISLTSHDFELYFEQKDFDSFINHLKSFNDVLLVHDVVEHAWGQRVIRFYDPDHHIIEVGECMETVVLRFIDQGMSMEETSIRTQHPITFIQNALLARKK